MGGISVPPGSAQSGGSIGRGQVCTPLSNQRERNWVGEIRLILTHGSSSSIRRGQVSAPPGFRLRTVLTRNHGCQSLRWGEEETRNRKFMINKTHSVNNLGKFRIIPDLESRYLGEVYNGHDERIRRTQLGGRSGVADPAVGQVSGGGYGLRDSNQGVALPLEGESPEEGQDAPGIAGPHSHLYETGALSLQGLLKPTVYFLPEMG